MILIAILIRLNAFASDIPRFSELRNAYLAEVQKQNRPIFISGCALRGGMSVLIQPAGAQPGKYLEIYWSRGEQGDPVMINVANIDIGKNEPLGEIMHGGLQTWRITNSIVKQLIHSPFQVFLPSDFDRIVRLRPSRRCDTKDPG